MTSDFSSALYLGLKHPHHSIPPWDAFSYGAPTALVKPAEAHRVEGALTRLLNCEKALMAPSTLHLVWDVFGSLPKDTSQLFVARQIYPVLQWGVERAIARKIPVHVFDALDSNALAQALHTNRLKGKRPVLVTDGWYTAHGRMPPLRNYMRLIRSLNGIMIIDDTQAVGILGKHPDASMPYGYGGGGSLAWNGISGNDIILLTSFAKGFGVPVAALGASKEWIQSFFAESETSIHSSPASIPALLALTRALRINHSKGDALRKRLLNNVRVFRKLLHRARFKTRGWLFPVQFIYPHQRIDAYDIQQYLAHHSIRSILLKSNEESKPRLACVLRADHSKQEISRFASIISQLTGCPSSTNLFPVPIGVL